MAGDDKNCGGCKYLGWQGLVRWCCHPSHPAPLPGWPHHCKDWTDLEAKNIGGHSYPAPVRLEQPA